MEFWYRLGLYPQWSPGGKPLVRGSAAKPSEAGEVFIFESLIFDVHVVWRLMDPRFTGIARMDIYSVVQSHSQQV